MPSQVSHQSSQSSPLCLPLLKLSYATVSNDNIVPIPWIHLSSKNALFAVFETSSARLEDGRTEERQKFKVLKDPEVMEELDLNTLSDEARRVQSHAPNASYTQMPSVAIIVKVPMIAIKYPLPSGQIRRFQIRFGKNEDYYEAMKMLARANVPTVEAGTFPSIKPQSAPQPPALVVAPDDSASQIGLDNSGARNYASNEAISSVSGSRRAPTAPPPMAPPLMASNSVSRPEYRPYIQPLAFGTAPKFWPAYAKSNISLSTATTLVPGKQDSRYNELRVYTGEVDNGLRQREHNLDVVQQSKDSASIQPAHISMLPQNSVRDLLPGGQDLPIHSTGHERINEHCSTRATTQTTSRTSQVQMNAPLQGAATDEPEPSTKTPAKGKGTGKRGAASNVKKAPAAKKPRATASSKKGQATPKDSAVPTVEQLLRQPGYSLLPDSPPTKTRSMPRVQKINQQERVTRSRQRGTKIPESDCGGENANIASPELGHATARRVTRSASQALACPPPGATNIQQSNIVPQAGPPPCTPADQIIGNPQTPASPRAQARTSPLKAMGPPLTQHHNHRDPSESLPAMQDDPLLSMAQQCMTMDENFDLTNSDSRLDAWHNLPTATRTTALNHYFCGLIMNDKFVELVKDTSLFWEGAILEGKVNRMTMRGAAGDSNDEEEEL